MVGSSGADLRRTLGQGLAETLVAGSAPVSAPGAGLGAGFGSAGRLDGEHGPQSRLLRGSTAELNRRHFGEHRQAVAAGLMAAALLSSTVLMVMVLIFIVAVMILGAFLFVRGWGTLAEFQGLPCDQPLASWLLAMLLFIPGSMALDRLMVSITGQGDRASLSQPVRRCRIAVLLARGVLVALGCWLLTHSTTCFNTNRELYHFTKIYLIFNLVLWALRAGVSSVLVWLVLFLAQSSLGTFVAPDARRAARPGLIGDLETLPFDPAHFSEEDADKEPPECCICQLGFSREGPAIKRTPCGHFFHEPCLGHWIGTCAKTCPLCRLNLEEAVPCSPVP